MYLGQPILADDLLYKPDSSLIKQSYHARFMSRMHNLAGFGMAAWNSNSVHAETPFIYKTAELPFYDHNLKHLANKINVNCLLAHVRGVPYSEHEVVAEQNVHPFIYPNCKIALAHNGNLMHFASMKYDLLDYITPAISKFIHGTTDSEWIYAVFISQFKNHTIVPSLNETKQAVLQTLAILSKVRQKHKIKVASPVNLFITGGNFLVATRFVFNFGCFYNDFHSAHLSNTYNSLWYTYGQEYRLHNNEYTMMAGERRASVLIASEPLTEDTTTWIEAPEYSLISAYLKNDEMKISTENIDF
jgi:glutamine amidotransferase